MQKISSSACAQNDGAYKLPLHPPHPLLSLLPGSISVLFGIRLIFLGCSSSEKWTHVVA
jgi:hypothetical protein